MTSVAFPGDAGPLRGHLHRPPGPGPFPAVMWNHGSEPQPGTREDLAAFYTAAGYVLFVPHRRGHGESPGEHFAGPLLSAARIQPRERVVAELVERWELDLRDTLAAAGWLVRQPDIDARRVAMSGVSQGAVQTLLAAEAGTAARAYVAFAPAAIGWEGNPEIQRRLRRAVRAARAPVLLVQAANDHSLGPSEELGAELRRADGPSLARVYPAFGRTPDEGHGDFACRGTDVWGAGVLEFLAQVLGVASPQPAA